MNNDQRIISLLEDILAWQRLAAREELLPFLQKVLADQKQLKAFDLTDGTRTQQQVATGAGLSQPAVSNLWAKWRRLGIVQDKNGKTVHIVKPSDYGLDVPESVASDGTVTAKKSKSKGGKPFAPMPTSQVDATTAAAADGVNAQ
jgi:hypothetical protein